GEPPHAPGPHLTHRQVRSAEKKGGDAGGDVCHDERRAADGCPEREHVTSRSTTSHTATTVLDVAGLVRRFGDLTAVDGVSFHIAPGETYGLLGPNGAGKTTTISMVAGLLAADAGEVRVVGERMGPREVAPKRRLGLVPQELAIYPDLS